MFVMDLRSVTIQRLCWWLPLIHMVLALGLIAYEESQDWRLHLMSVDTRDRISRYDQEHHQMQSKAAQEQDVAFQEWARMEFRLAAAARPLYGAELPAALLVGWFYHPISADFGGFLQRWLFDLTLGMAAARKVFLLDGILILAIGTQWWLVGLWLRTRQGKNQNIKFPLKVAILITIGAIVSAALCRVGVLELISVLAAFGCMVLWLVLLVNMILATTRSAWPWLRAAMGLA